MSEQLTRELVERLAEVLGTTAPVIWAAYLRQQAIQPVGQLVCTLLAVGAGLLEIRAVWRWAAAKEAATNDGTFVAAGVVAGLMALFATAVLAIDLYEAVLHLLNPEFYAIDALLRAARGGK